MLIVFAFALLAVGLVLLSVHARRTRTLWPAVAVIAAATILLGVEVRALYGAEKRLDASLAKSCDVLARDLRADVADYQRLKEPGWGPELLTKLQDSYSNAFTARRRWARVCVQESRLGCIPDALNDRTLTEIEQAAKSIQERAPCTMH